MFSNYRIIHIIVSQKSFRTIMLLHWSVVINPRVNIPHSTNPSYKQQKQNFFSDFHMPNYSIWKQNLVSFLSSRSVTFLLNLGDMYDVRASSKHVNVVVRLRERGHRHQRYTRCPIDKIGISVPLTPTLKVEESSVSQTPNRLLYSSMSGIFYNNNCLEYHVNLIKRINTYLISYH